MHYVLDELKEHFYKNTNTDVLLAFHFVTIHFQIL